MNVRVTHTSGSAYRVMPWKNGKGSTTELLIHPPEGSVQNGFDWRISLAHVPDSGPFSAFQGYDRTIMLLRGDPMRLLHEGQGEHLLEAFQPYSFSGGWSTTGILTGRAVDDFNVMIRGGLGKVYVQVYRGRENTVFHQPRASAQFVWVFQGQAQVKIQDQSHDLLENESLMIEYGPDLVIHTASPETTVITVSMHGISVTSQLHKLLSRGLKPGNWLDLLFNNS